MSQSNVLIQRTFGALLLVAVSGVFVTAASQSVQAANAGERAAAARIRAGDRIELQFRRDRELNSSISVSERGEAVFPKLGTLDVARFTIASLQDTLRARYSEYLRD